MNLPSGEQAARALHDAYLAATGYQLTLNSGRLMDWARLHTAGVTPDDVRLVVHYLKREIAREKRNPGALKLSNITVLERFEEDRELARQACRKARTGTAPPVRSVPAGERAGLDDIASLKAALR